MYPVSEAFLRAVQENTRRYYWTGRITTKGGAVYPFGYEDIVKGSGYISAQCCGSAEIELGTVYAAEMGVTLFSQVDRYTLDGAKVELFYHLRVEGGGFEEGVRFVDRRNGAADEDAPINWSYEFSGAVNYLPTCVTEAEYLVNLANLKGHSYGITLCGKNHFGSFINGNAMRPPEGANLHQFLTRNEMGSYSPLTDLMANGQLVGKTVLYMLDALVCATSEGSSVTEETARWRQAPFDGNYTSSVFVSQDPVAIDSVGADFLINEPAVTEHNGALRDNPNVENYLHEAALIQNALSGNVYYNGYGEAVENLGVHEHWNNSTEKMYSRNLGKEKGIELVRIQTK